MDGWWSTLSLALKIFYGIGIGTSLLMVLQLVLMLFGMDGDSDVGDGADVDGEHSPGGGVLSVRTVTAFFVGFGWTGAGAIDSGLALTTSILLATAVGGAFMGGILFLMRALYGLRYSGTLDYRNAIGKVGTVYLPVPAAMARPGQIEVLVQGRLRVVQAFTRSVSDLPNQSRVRVVDLMDPNTLIVEAFEPTTSEEQ